MLWITIGGLAVFAAAFLLFGFLRRPRGHASRVEYDLEVYRAQLGELERERELNLISDHEAEAARIEIQRRILTADQAREADRAERPAKRNALAAAAIAAGVPLAAFGLYLALGNPEIPSVPFAERPPAPAATQQGRNEAGQGNLPGIETMLARVRERLAENPDDHAGWSILGRSLISLGQYEEAIAAYDRAISLSDGDAELYGAKAEAMISAAQGAVTPEARAVLEQALSLDPGDPRTRFYMAAAKQQAGNTQAALDDLVALLGDAPADAPWFDPARQHAAALAIELGLDPDTILPEVRVAAAGPSRADTEAAADMTAEQQQEMIRGMVGNLAARLKDNPDDLQGWQMLARSYLVLGERDKAAEAYRHILTLEPTNTDALFFLAEAASAQGEKDQAVGFWTRLLGLLTPGSAEHATVRERLNRLGAAN